MDSEPRIFDRLVSNEGFEIHPEPEYKEDKRDKDGDIVIDRLGGLNKEYTVVFKTGKVIRVSQSDLNLKNFKGSI